MKTTAITFIAIGFLGLSACSESPQEASGDLAEQQMESREDVLEEQADLAEAMGNETQEEVLDERADAMGDAAGEAEEAAEERMGQ